MTEFETFEIEAGAGSAGLLTAGRILRALARGADVRSEDVGVIADARQGTALVEIATARALRLSTPRLVPTDEGGKAALFVLRRPDDLVDEGRAELLLTSEEGHTLQPGEAALSLADALGIFAEDIGFGLAGPGFLRVSVPLGALVGPVPASIGIGGRKFRVENLAKKT